MIEELPVHESQSYFTLCYYVKAMQYFISCKRYRTTYEALYIVSITCICTHTYKQIMI